VKVRRSWGTILQRPYDSVEKNIIIATLRGDTEPRTSRTYSNDANISTAKFGLNPLEESCYE